MSVLQLTTIETRKPDTRELLPLDEYDYILVSFSGGRDSVSLVLHMLDLGVPREKLQLWHQNVDGVHGIDPPFIDWPCTHEYVKAFGRGMGIPVFFQSRVGGFLGEMMKEGDRTKHVIFDRQNGHQDRAGGERTKIGTRLRFPQKTSDLMVRWCSAVLKIDAFALALNNEPDFVGAKLLVLTGERRQESAGRARYAEREPHRCDSGRKRVDAWRAVIDWSEERVWDALRRHRIQPHPAYRLGFPRVSCLSCIFADTNQWASIRKIAPDMFNRILSLERQFNCTITRGRDVEQMADRGVPYPETDDVELVRLAMSHTEAPQVLLAEGEPWKLPGGAYRHGGGPT